MAYPKLADSETQEGLPSNCANVWSAFTQDMPIELVERILNRLDLLSMLKCRYVRGKNSAKTFISYFVTENSQVCSTFRHLIDSSPYFQWNVELAIAGKEDSGTNYPLAASRRMLAQHQRGWVDLQWTEELRVPSDRGWMLHGGVLARVPHPRSTLRLTRLPSQSRSIEERHWTIDIGRFSPDFLLMVPTQDLLVIRGSVFHRATVNLFELHHRRRRGPTCQIFLLTLSTGDPHPLATGIITHTLTHELPLPNRELFYVCNDILGVKFGVFDRTEFTFWNWKTGSVLAVSRLRQGGL
jgi:hypothetical protein